MRVLGTDCSEEFDEVHTAEGGKKQLPGFCIGSLKEDEKGYNCAGTIVLNADDLREVPRSQMCMHAQMPCETE